ncbi:toxin VasX, partial [Burkholderia thailandensis]|uniref:toxin VasX n=1 Tax=Burkholderia thailandensis TaxID=57975 RepID=UPI0036F2A6E0
MPLTQSKYGLRQLREGFVYCSTNRARAPVSLGSIFGRAGRYALEATGYASVKRVSAPQLVSERGIARRVSVSRHREPHQCGNVWIAFSEWPWSKDTVSVRGNDAAPQPAQETMQLIEPSNGIGADRGRIRAADGGQSAACLEHALLSRHGEGEPVGLLARNCRRRSATGLARFATLACKFVRRATHGPCATRLRRVQSWPGRGNGQAAEGSTRNAKVRVLPMMWRCGTASDHARTERLPQRCAARFCSMRRQALRINALQWIDQAKLGGTGARRKATFDHSPAHAGQHELVLPGAVAKQRRREDSGGSAVLERLSVDGETAYPSYARQITQFRAAPSSPAIGCDGEGAQYVEAKPRIEQIARKRSTRTPLPNRARLGEVSREIGGRYVGQEGASNGNVKRIDVFRILYQRIQDQKQALLAQRTADVANWL